MLTANELRPGNYALFQNQHLLEACGITQTLFHFLEKGTSKVNALPLKDMHGVPLSVEVLERLGFEKQDPEPYTDDETWAYDDFKIALCNDEFWWTQYTQATIVIKSLHHLQNLYFAVTGDEIILLHDTRFK